MVKNYYRILNVDKNASQEQIIKAYKQLAKRLHPDKNKNSDASEKMKELNEAISVLKDSEKRKLHDEYLANKANFKKAPIKSNFWKDFAKFYSHLFAIFILILIVGSIIYGLTAVDYSFVEHLSNSAESKLTSLFGFEPDTEDEPRAAEIQAESNAKSTSKTKSEKATTTTSSTTTTTEFKPYEISTKGYSIIIKNNLKQEIRLLIKYRRFSNWFGVDEEAEINLEVASLAKVTFVDPKFQANDGCSHAPCQISIISHSII
jgi:curved DNA-binding protein CbpA